MDLSWDNYITTVGPGPSPFAMVGSPTVVGPGPSVGPSAASAETSRMTPTQNAAIAATWNNPNISIDEKKRQMEQFGVGVTDVMAATGQNLNTVAGAFNQGGDWGGLHFNPDGSLYGTDWAGPVANQSRTVVGPGPSTGLSTGPVKSLYELEAERAGRTGAGPSVGPAGTLGQGDSGWLMDEWYGQQYPWLRGQLNTATAQAQNAGAQFMNTGTGAMSDYNSTFRPNYQKLNDFIGRYNDPAYLAQQRAQAMEGAQAQFDSQDDALRRRMQGMGVGSGAVADALASQASQRAMAKVNAATQSDRELGKTYGDALAGMTGLGLKVADLGNTSLKNGVSSYSAPLTWGSDVAKTGGALSGIDNTTKLGLINADTNDYQARQNAGTNWYNAESNRIQANNGTLNANNTQKNYEANNNPWTNFTNSIASSATSALTDSLFGKRKTGLSALGIDL